MATRTFSVDVARARATNMIENLRQFPDVFRSLDAVKDHADPDWRAAVDRIIYSPMDDAARLQLDELIVQALSGVG